MDIEGSEFDWVNSLPDVYFQCIRQIVIEIHAPFDEMKWKLLTRFSGSHWLVHLHANNSNRPDNRVGNIYVPTVFECTYIRKESTEEMLQPSVDPIPGPLDQRNSIDYPEINLI